MIFFDITTGGNHSFPLDDSIGIKRIVLTGSIGSGSQLLIADGTYNFLSGSGLNPFDFTFPETSYGYPAPSLFYMKKTGEENGRIFIETSPFVNPNYFEKGEITA